MNPIERMYDCLHIQGKSAADLCRYLNITSSVMAGWKATASIPPSKYLVRISEFLNISIDFLLTGKEYREDVQQEQEQQEQAPQQLTNDEYYLLHLYNLASTDDRATIIRMLECFSQSQKSYGSEISEEISAG